VESSRSPVPPTLPGDTMIISSGWESGKFVILVAEDDGKILHRISMTKEEWEKIKNHAAWGSAGGVMHLKNHEQMR
jgi:hypothetical protein